MRGTGTWLGTVESDGPNAISFDSSFGQRRQVLSVKLVKKATLKIYPGGSHNLGDTSKEQLNKDLLEFIKS